jgi:hypothetical protein
VHLIGALVSLVLFVVVRWGWHDWRPGPALRDALLILPSVLVLAAWWVLAASKFRGPSLPEFLVGYYLQEYVQTFGERLMLLAHDNRLALDGLHGKLAGWLFTLPILGALVAALAWRRGGGHEGDWDGDGIGDASGSGSGDGSGDGSGVERRSHRAPVTCAIAFFLAATLLYLVLPDRVPGNWALYQRMTVYALLAAIPVASLGARDGLRPFWPLLIVIVCAAHLVMWYSHLERFELANAGFDAAFLPEPVPGTVLAGLTYEELNGIPVYMHGQCYYIVWKHGISTAHVVDYRFASVRRRVDHATLPPHEDLVTIETYEGGYGDVEYVLARRGTMDALPPAFDRFELLRTTGGWGLYRRAAARADSTPRHEP